MNSITATELSRILEDEILPRVEKPSRYLGCEVNATRKEAAPGDVRIALAFPDLYDLGLPNLGLLILYDILNRREGVHAERVYAPGLDLEAILRERRLPLFSLESRTPLAQFDCIGFTLQYELCYTNLLNMLDLAGIPLQSSQREDRHPIILAGGPCALNPEPLADFIDAFAIGDGEEVIVEIAEALRATKGVPRAERLRRLAEIEGVYVPALYETRTLPDGTVLPVGPKVRKRVVALEGAPFPTEYVVPFTQQVHDRVSLEVLRGCTQGCRFCQAGMMNRPVRERSLKTLRELQEAALRATGYEEIALASLSTCDYSRVRSLVAQTVEAATPWGTAVSLPSLRLDSFSVDLVEMVQSMRKSGLTFAPEAATPRLRAVINKGITDEDLLETTAEVFRRGWEVVKLYFMIGLPTETEEDVAAIAELSRRVLAGGRSFRRNARINLGVSTFVPRPHTPFQWERQISLEETQAKQRLLAERLRGGVKFGRHDAFASYLEGVFARGDRRVGGALLEAWRRGARMDAWSEHFDFARWQEAFATVGLNPDDYLRER
ncbi:MAG TPA: TIGR03960 family B12-binding radical SAM protein, partial [Armatimonadota bacterium]|nr:TIGR03960 family B12-binding radical SAM protein [Armatimonadota bacterium]